MTSLPWPATNLFAGSSLPRKLRQGNAESEEQSKSLRKENADPAAGRGVLIVNIAQQLMFKNMKNTYLKLAVMLFISFFVMYGVMFLNVDQTSHIYLSVTRLYMSLLMVAPMAMMMILLMWRMFKHKKTNIAIISGSVVVFFGALFLLRTQAPINDVQYMKAMIPHHSSAILTSQEANIQDPRVKELSEQIIEAQVNEIELMKELINELE